MGGARQVLAVAVTALVAVMISVALGTLLFTGALADHASIGVTIALFSSFVLGTVIALRGSITGQVAGVQDSPTILLALAAGAVASAAPATLAREDVLASVLALIAVATLTTGAAAWALGRFRLGAVIRFMPYPVVGGFLAGTGWLVVAGSVEMLTDTVATDGISTLLAAEVMVRWAPPLVLACLLVWLLERWEHPLLLPVTISGALVAFFGLAALLGHGPRALLDAGWLLGPFTDSAAWRPDPVWVAQHADWSLVAAQAGTVVSLVLVVLASIVLTSSGLEVALDTEADVDRELRAAGLANLLAGAFGGTAGYTWLSDTVLGRSLGGRGRTFAVTVAAMSGVVLLIGTAPLGWFPRPVVGLLLMLIGLMFLHDWVLKARRRMPHAEYAIVLAILAVIATFGFLPGVAFGVGLAIVMFAVAASRVEVVKHELTGNERTSLVDRAKGEEVMLASARGHVHVLVLHGFLFFGTAHEVAQRLRRRLEDASRPTLQYVVLDFRLVTGVDSSAVFAFTKLHRRLSAAGTALVLSELTPDARKALEGGSVLAEPDVVVAPDLDHALEWCENRILEGYEGPKDLSDLRSVLDSLLAGVADASALLSLFEPVSLSPGETLIDQGAAPAGLYLVTAGEVSVERTNNGGPPVRMRLLRSGAVVGEMSLYLHAPASASVVAVSEVEAAFLSTAAFQVLEADQPAVAASLHRALVATLAKRLSDSHRAIEALRG